MRKYLISVLIFIIIILLAVALVNGIKIGNFQIKSIDMIKTDSDQLENGIQEINQKQLVTYTGKSDELETKAKELKKQKENYADLILYNSEDENSNLNLYENYEIEYLWTKLGNYATKNGLIMKLEVTNSTIGVDKTYNLNFTLNGEYVSIIDCISEIEDDSTLGFKIENFKLIQEEIKQNEEDEENRQYIDNEVIGTLRATFTVQNVNINNIEELQNSTYAEEIEEEIDTDTNIVNDNNNTSDANNANTL